MDVDRAHWPTELRLLLGPEATEVLGAAAAEAGGRLLRWTARQVTHQPGRSTTVRYEAEVAYDGTATTETLVAATGRRIPPGAAVLDDGTTQVAAWRWPHDPSLPGLAAALDPMRTARLLDDLGIGGDAVQLGVRAYRPGRRAVIEVTGRRGRVFLKVVRPDRVEALHDAHRALAAHLPVPDSLGWTDDGIVVLPGLPGRTLREALRGSAAVPAPAAIEALLDRLPPSLVGRPRRPDLLSGAAGYGATIAAVLPSAAGRIDDLVGALAAHQPADHDLVPVHGDLYEAQVLVADGRVTGLLDVDTAGPGHRIDDLANLCAHLSVLALACADPRPVKRYGAAVLAHAETTQDRRDLRARIAAAVVGLATGPFRVLEARWPQATERRLELAGSWLT